MQTMTNGTAAFLTMLAAISTTTFAHEGHDHSHGTDQTVSPPERNQPPGDLTNEAPPFGTLPPGHSPNDGHDHGNTSNQLPPQPTRVNPRSDSNPFYPSPNRFVPNPGNGVGRFDRTPTPEFTPHQPDNWGRPTSPYTGGPSEFGRDLPYDESRIGHGCSSGSFCPHAVGSSHQPVPFQYSGYFNPPPGSEPLHSNGNWSPAYNDCDKCRNYQSCPLNH